MTTPTRKKSIRTGRGNIMNTMMSDVQRQGVRFLNNTGLPSAQRNGNPITSGFRITPNTGAPGQPVVGPRFPRGELGGPTNWLAQGDYPPLGTLGGNALYSKDSNMATQPVNLKIAIARPPGYDQGQEFPQGALLFLEKEQGDSTQHVRNPAVVMSMVELNMKFENSFLWHKSLIQNGMRDTTVIGAGRSSNSLLAHEQHALQRAMQSSMGEPLHRANESLGDYICTVDDYCQRYLFLGPFVTPGAQGAANDPFTRTYKTKGTRSGSETIAYTYRGIFDRLLNMFGNHLRPQTRLFLMVTKEQVVRPDLMLTEQVTAPLIVKPVSTNAVARPLYMTNPDPYDKFLAEGNEEQKRITQMLLLRGEDPVCFLREFGQTYNGLYEDSNSSGIGGYMDRSFRDIDHVYHERTMRVDWRLKLDSAAVIPVGMVQHTHYTPGSMVSEEDVRYGITNPDIAVFAMIQRASSLTVMCGSF